MFNPKQYVTRGEAVNVLYRILTGVKETTKVMYWRKKARLWRNSISALCSMRFLPIT